MEGRHREEEEDMDVDTRQERIKPTLTGHTLDPSLCNNRVSPQQIQHTGNFSFKHFSNVPSSFQLV